MKPKALPLLTLLLLTLPAAAQSPLIGIFESHSAGTGDNQGKPGVRVLFYQSGAVWRPFNAACKDQACLSTVAQVFPRTTTWTLFRFGHALTKVTATTPDVFHFYSEIGVQAITNPAAVAGLEPPPSPYNPDPPHSILASNLPSPNDPEQWQPGTLTASDITLVRRAFRKSFPHPKNCVSSQTPASSKPWKYTDDDLHPINAFRSNKGWQIAQLILAGYRCDGPPDEAFVDHWYAIGPMGTIIPLGRLMHFAGAADFARNGRSQLLFSNGGDNDGGYKLFYDTFSHHVQAIITYH